MGVFMNTSESTSQIEIVLRNDVRWMGRVHGEDNQEVVREDDGPKTLVETYAIKCSLRIRSMFVRGGLRRSRFCRV